MPFSVSPETYPGCSCLFFFFLSCKYIYTHRKKSALNKVCDRMNIWPTVHRMFRDKEKFILTFESSGYYFLWLLPFLLHSFSFCTFVWRFSQLGFKVGKHRCSDHKAAFPRVKAKHCINQHTWEFHSLSASRGLLKTDMLELFKLPL